MELVRLRQVWTKPKYRTWTIALIVLAAGGFLALHNLNSPAIGTLDKGAATPAAAADISKLKTYRGKYIAFEAPTFFTLKSTKNTGARDLENFNLSKPTAPFWQLNINVATLSGPLSEDASYKLRAGNPDNYERSQISAGGKTFTVFSNRMQNYDKAAFIDSAGKETTINLSSSNEPDTDLLDQTFNAILASFNWR